jgi:hypothetical protein
VRFLVEAEVFNSGIAQVLYLGDGAAGYRKLLIPFQLKGLAHRTEIIAKPRILQ